MNVWLLWENNEAMGNLLHGVFASEELAEQRLDDMLKWTYYTYDMDTNELELDIPVCSREDFYIDAVHVFETQQPVPEDIKPPTWILERYEEIKRKRGDVVSE